MNDARAGIAKQRIGQVLGGKWRMGALLGVGGMAAVYAATHRNGKRAALKLLHPELSADPEVRARFLREGYAANTIGHPGCVSVLDDETAEDGSVFVVMELLEGETFEARAERLGGRLPPAEVVTLADQLLDVLAAAHDKGVVHRDLKPDNLFLTREGRVKVLDFGLARLREGNQAKLTITGAVMGTPAFMPPEQALAKWDQVDARSDLWAVGATMFTLLTGRLVHEVESITALLVAISTRPVDPIASVLPDIPLALSAVVDRALALDRDHRFSDARSMQVALRAAIATSPALNPVALVIPAAPSQAVVVPGRTSPLDKDGSTGETLAASTAAIPPRTRRSALPLVGVVVLALGGAGAVVLAFSGRNTRDKLKENAAAAGPSVAAPSDTVEKKPVPPPTVSPAPASPISAAAPLVSAQASAQASAAKPTTKVVPTARTGSTVKSKKPRDAMGKFN